MRRQPRPRLQQIINLLPPLRVHPTLRPMSPDYSGNDEPESNERWYRLKFTIWQDVLVLNRPDRRLGNLEHDFAEVFAVFEQFVGGSGFAHGEHVPDLRTQLPLANPRRKLLPCRLHDLRFLRQI